MAPVEPLTLYREKSTVHRFGDSGASEAALVVRSNRIAMTLERDGIREQVVVRGQNIAATLRLTAVVLDQFRRDSGSFRREQPVDWNELWLHRVSDYERLHNPEGWVSIHRNGRRVFTSREDTTIDEIERLARGAEIDETLLRGATRTLIGPTDDLVIQHDSQTAAVVTPFKEYHRGAVLDRHGGRTGSFALSVHHPDPPRRKVRLAGFLNYIADVIEALNQKAFLERIRQMVDEDTGKSGSPATPALVSAAMARKRDLMQFIVAYERAHKLTYRPERPDFF
ncbi:hypothetical protein [Roseospirillum parvum]|uniref:Uncharacterized protein n=1 Tax=Roseospirillum parvum TaxID=83401 RepID=A0A1G8ARL7_9PROT|nr:hypothetical protein [Roseospirillum parvum]SDH23567.1 hypothetical protein SAMN05421742_10584 [Roseospirillum parvum]